MLRDRIEESRNFWSPGGWLRQSREWFSKPQQSNHWQQPFPIKELVLCVHESSVHGAGLRVTARLLPGGVQFLAAFAGSKPSNCVCQMLPANQIIPKMR